MLMYGKCEMLRRALLASVVMAPVLHAAVAHAQESADVATETAAAQSGGRLEEIVVTAQRREQNLQQVPVAVTALSANTLTQRGITNTMDLMKVAPGLQVSTQSGGGNGTASATFFLRGMGQQRGGNGSEPAVGIYIDDIYYPTLQGTLFNIVDLDHVEVLRGPQGTLFGRNTIGGAIRYTSKSPSKEFEGSISATVGNYDRYDLTGYVNIPVGDALAFRLTGGHLEKDGFAIRQDGGPKAGAEETDLVRLQVRVEPTEKLRIDLSAQYMESLLEGMAYATPSPVNPVAGTDVALYNASAAGLLNPYDARYNARCGRCQPGSNYREFADTEATNASATIRYDFSDAFALKLLSGYTKVKALTAIDYDASALSIFHQNQSFEAKAFSQELQINAKLFDDRLNLVGGLFYYDDRFINDGLISVQFIRAANGITPATAIRRDTTTKAAFLDGSFDLTEKLTLIFGGRVSKDTKHVYASRPTGLIASDAGSFSSTTGRIGLRYQWSRDIMTYATISDGFRGGGFNYVAASRRFFRFNPETSRSYEFGARMDFLDRRVRFNPTFFYNDWKNIQVQSIDNTTGTLVLRLDNAAKAHTYGIEVETQVSVDRHLQFFGTLATLKAKYDALGAATGITLASKFMRAPELTYSLGATYDREIAGGYKAVATVSYSWADDQVSTPTDSDFMALPSYGVLNARLDLSDPKERYTVSLFATNLTNEVYYIGGVRFSKNVGVDRVDLGRPREFGVTLKAKF